MAGTADGGPCPAGTVGWFAAGLYRSTAYRTLLYLYNPLATEQTVTLTYAPASGSPIVQTLLVAAGARLAVPVADHLGGRSGDFALAVAWPIAGSAALAVSESTGRPIVISDGVWRCQ